jgi:trimeric autotransporter adhesin
MPSRISTLFVVITLSGCGSASSNVPATSISVVPDSASLVPGSTIQLAVGTSQPVSWSSSLPAVATVSGTGLVTAIGVGRARVTATDEGGSGFATVTVAEVAVASILLSQDTTTIVLNHSAQLSAIPLDAQGRVISGRLITWATHAAPIAMVSSNGLVTAAGLGTAQIFVTCDGVTVIATINVVLGS